MRSLPQRTADVRLFEIGSAFAPRVGGGLPVEELRIAALMLGRRRPPHFTEPAPPPIDEWDAKGVAEALIASAHPGAPWELHYGDIEGFDWKMGVEYVLRVRETTVARPPADGSSLRWTLVEVLDSSEP